MSTSSNPFTGPEYGSRHAPIIVAAFIEAHDLLFRAWLKEAGINPALGINQWRRAMALQHNEILGVAQLRLTVRPPESACPDDSSRSRLRP